MTSVQPMAPLRQGSTSFESVDTDGSGAISLEEVAAWVRSNDIDLDGRDLEDVFREIDKDSSGAIEASEFDSDR